ncbi:putative bifunctional diguanylate cyclase/phosphodiesterase [Egicoccus sp. AB-alg6-2]|uniref:putative bifunctional diguanylate cyclase/phosphodiesterase n=1 Tax=Egicoccus sp. AB-alg6-2 TaxID=3242692 RepID=UPI00359D2D3C
MADGELPRARRGLRGAVGGCGARFGRIRPSLLAKYGLTSLLLFVALGSVLGHVLQASAQGRILDSALREAQVVARLGVQNSLTPEEVTNGLTPSRVDALERAFVVSLSALDTVEVRIWNRDGRIVFASERDTIGSAPAPSTGLRQALDGEAVAVITEVADSPNPFLRRHGVVLEAFTPLRFGSGPGIPAEGVIAVTLPYGPVAEAIQSDTWRLLGVLAIALAVLWGVLFRLVFSASAALREQSEQNEHQAMHDGLTGLPNRSLFADRLDHAVAHAERTGERLGVILMDLDRFKEVNDTLGHHHGDVLLTKVAERLHDTLRTGDTVARLGGDEFAFLLPDVGEEVAIDIVATKIRDALERPFDILGLPLEIGASLGVAVYPDHASTGIALVQKADVAMYTAKREHRGHAVYDAADDGNSRDRLALAGELREAIDRGELVVHYQPKVCLRTRRMTDAEALVRWDHPVHGRMAPDVFIPVAERSDLIAALTEYVLDVALRDCRRWNDLGTPAGVAVNLSVRNLRGGDLVDTVAELLARHEVPAAWLTLEITETMIATNPVRARDAVLALRALGVRLSIDDFGTGYSSLALLRSMPVSELKIDRSFVADLRTSNDAEAIVGFSNELGHRLDLVVVAEGVEDEATAEALARLGCDLAQGYWFARPLPVEVLLEHLDDDSRIVAAVEARV